MKRIKLLQYKWAGKKWFIKIKSPCQECDLTTTILKDLSENRFKGKIDLEIRPWLDNSFRLLLKGGWHAPIVIVNGKIFSQGHVPDKKKLQDRLDQILDSSP